MKAGGQLIALLFQNRQLKPLLQIKRHFMLLAVIKQWVFEAVKSTQSTLSYPIPFKEILLAGFFSTNATSGFCEKLSSYNTANATTYQYQACYGGFLLAIGTV